MHALLLAAALSNPAAAADAPVTAEPVAIDDLSVTLSGASFDLVLEVTRTRGMAVGLRKIGYTLAVNGIELPAQTRSYEDVRLRRDKSVRINVPVELSMRQVAEAATRGLSSGTVEVSITGTAGVTLLFIPLTVPFQTELVRLGG